METLTQCAECMVLIRGRLLFAVIKSALIKHFLKRSPIDYGSKLFLALSLQVYDAMTYQQKVLLLFHWKR